MHMGIRYAQPAALCELCDGARHGEQGGLVVVVENGGSGSHTAGTIANTVLQAAVKK